MSADSRKPVQPAPTSVPRGSTPESGQSGVGAQTALLALIRKRRQRVEHDEEAVPSTDDPKDSAV